MKKWFLTNNHQILDLNSCKEFWIEEIPGTNKIFCKSEDDIEWLMAEIEDRLQAETYLFDIYKKLND